MRRTSLRRAAAVTVVAAALAAGVTACSSEQHETNQAGPAPIRIGAIYSLSGAQWPLDSPSLDGARLAVEEINAAGGLMGRRVELLERDGQSSPSVVRTVARDLVGDHVSAIIGLSDTDLVLAAAPVAAAAGIPFVTSGATSPKLPAEVPRWLFMASFGDNQQAAAGAEFAVQRLGAHTAAVLYDDQLSYAQLLEKYFSTSFRAQRGVVVLTRGFHAGDENVKAMLAPLRPRGTITGDDDEDDAVIPHTRRIVPDVVYLAAGPDEAGPLLGKLRKAGYDGPVLGGDSFDDVGLIAAAEATGGRVWFTTHAALGARHSTGAMRRFAQLYASAYGRQPQNSFAGLGFDAVNLVAHAVLEAGSVKPAAVRDALAATRTFAGVTGSLSYPAGGMAPRKAVTVIAVGRRPELAAVLVPRHVAKP